MGKDVKRAGDSAPNPGWFAPDTSGKDNTPSASAVPAERAGIPERETRRPNASLTELFTLMNREQPQFASAADQDTPADPGTTASTPAHEAYLARCQESGDNMTTVMTSRCTMCNQAGAVTMSTADWEAGSEARKNGAMVQNCFPMLDPEVREQLMTGMHPSCFDRMLGRT